MAEIKLEEFFPYRVNRIADAISLRFRKTYRDQFGLTIPEWRVLATLGQFKRTTAKEIGRHSGMHKTKVSRAIREIEQRRWLTRQVSAADRREEILMLTREGRRAYTSIVPGMLSNERALLDELGAASAKAVLVALERLERVLNLRDRSPPLQP
jgi:DNA-binding MarR family transcriptional regulator